MANAFEWRFYLNEEGTKEHNQRLSAQSALSLFNFYLCFKRINKWHAADTDLANFHGFINLCFQFIQLF